MLFGLRAADRCHSLHFRCFWPFWKRPVSHLHFSCLHYYNGLVVGFLPNSALTSYSIFHTVTRFILLNHHNHVILLKNVQTSYQCTHETPPPQPAHLPSPLCTAKLSTPGLQGLGPAKSLPWVWDFYPHAFLSPSICLPLKLKSALPHEWRCSQYSPSQLLLPSLAFPPHMFYL